MSWALGDPVNYPLVGVANSESCCQATLINDPTAVCKLLMHKSLIINGNLKTQMTGIEVAFTYVPSGFYSGLCSDSPYQMGLLTSLCSTQGGMTPSGSPHPLLLPISPTRPTAFRWCWTNSHPRGRHPIAQQSPAQPSDSPAGLSNLHADPSSITHRTELSQEVAMAPYLCVSICKI